MNSNKLKNLNRLFNPKNIAVFGGNDAEIVISQCKKMGFKGEIWPVNPKRESINGIKCFSSVSDLPKGPDASFIAVPRSAAIEVVKELNKMKSGGGVCYTAGFREVGQEGEELEKRLLENVGDFALIGPNCYGMINYVKDNQPKKVLMVTEYSMSDNISVENPNVNFVRPCNLCPHMKTINLENILESLWNKKTEIKINPEIAIKAKQAIVKMIEL